MTAIDNGFYYDIDPVGMTPLARRLGLGYYQLCMVGRYRTRREWNAWGSMYALVIFASMDKYLGILFIVILMEDVSPSEHNIINIYM